MVPQNKETTWKEKSLQPQDDLITSTDCEISSAEDGVQVFFGLGQFGLGLVHQGRGAPQQVQVLLQALFEQRLGHHQHPVVIYSAAVKKDRSDVSGPV